MLPAAAELDDPRSRGRPRGSFIQLIRARRKTMSADEIMKAKFSHRSGRRARILIRRDVYSDIYFTTNIRAQRDTVRTTM